MLLLTASTLVLLIAWQARPPRVPRGLRWLCSWGRLSYEPYLSHMFVVFAIVQAYRLDGADPRAGFLWYVPAFVLCWVLGKLVARGFSMPCERWLRQHWLRPVPVAAQAAYRER